MAKSKPLDPKRIAERTYAQFARLLDMLEDPENIAEVTIPQLINALKALMAYDLTAIRKTSEQEYAGSAITKYARTFEANAAGRGKANAGRRARAALSLAASDTDDRDDE